MLFPYQRGYKTVFNTYLKYVRKSNPMQNGLKSSRCYTNYTQFILIKIIIICPGDCRKCFCFFNIWLNSACLQTFVNSFHSFFQRVNKDPHWIWSWLVEWVQYLQGNLNSGCIYGTTAKFRNTDSGRKPKETTEIIPLFATMRATTNNSISNIICRSVSTVLWREKFCIDGSGCDSKRFWSDDEIGNLPRSSLMIFFNFIYFYLLLISYIKWLYIYIYIYY